MTMSTVYETSKVVKGRVIHLVDQPITFEQFLEIAGEKDDVELVKAFSAWSPFPGFIYRRISRCEYLD